ncbi:MAG: diguanylate cyclase [Lachnospiraceae bacterium]|nr:diguanylate cyclase [Lachnospiraceae bacterium]
MSTQKETKWFERYKIFFRIIVMGVMLSCVIFSLILPNETDYYFEVSKEQSAKTENVKDELLYEGSFEWIKSTGEHVAIALPGRLDIPRGEVVVLESRIPEDFVETAIILRSSQQDVRIFIGGELRVDYNTVHSRPVGSQTTSRYVICKTGREDAGAMLRIETRSDATEYSGVVNEVFACDKMDFWLYIYKQYGADVFFGLFLIFIGIFTIGVSICLTIGFKGKYDLEFIGWCVLLVGGWLLGESKLRQLMVDNSSVLSNLCFIIIMLAPVPLMIFLNGIQNGRYKKWFRTISFLAYANFGLSCFLQICNLVDFVDDIFVSHIILVISFFVVLATFFVDARRGFIREYKGICFGMLCLMISVIIEVIMMYMMTVVSGMIVTIGVLIFVGTAFIKTVKDIRSRERKKQEERLNEQRKQSETMSMQMIQTLSNTLEAKDEYTRGHSRRVADYSVLIARRLGMSEEQVAKLHYAASLHDIGKIGVPDIILNKPTRLSDEEYTIIKKHTTIGADILKNVELITFTEKVARYHHERYDGKGYPEGLSGEEIPYEARIVALADSFDAMNSKRIYRNPLSKEAVREEIVKNAGKQFDPEMVTCFLELFDEGAFEKGNVPENDVAAGDSEGQSLLAENMEANKLLSMVMETMNSTSKGEGIDFLTKLPTRVYGEQQIIQKMKEGGGVLVFVDMDNLKKINDIHGHRAGDEALQCVGEVLSSLTENGVACRIGGDEFLLYIPTADRECVTGLLNQAMQHFEQKKKEKIQIQGASLSMGICKCAPGDDFQEVLSKADKALYHVKHQGKNGYHWYYEQKNEFLADSAAIDIEKLMESIRQSGSYDGAMEVEYREFAKLYEYLGKVCERYKHTCHVALITLDVKSEETIYIDDIEQAMHEMEIAIRENIRNVDICTRYSSMQFLVVLLEAGQQNIDPIMQRIFMRFHKICQNTKFSPDYESRSMSR